MTSMGRLVLGFVGPSGVGKTTAAEHLTRTQGFTRLSFATPLKMLLINELRCTPQEVYETKPPYVRDLLQKLGDIIRELDPDYFLKQSRNEICCVEGNIVFDDVRFRNEAAEIRAQGGKVIRIQHSGIRQDKLTGLQARHISETEQAEIEPDMVLNVHYGNPELLQKTVEIVAKGMREKFNQGESV